MPVGMRWMIVLALAVTACGSHSYRPRDPVLAPIAEGGQLICDPYDGATGYQPPGGKVWALNDAARERLRTPQGAALFTDVPISARANLDPAFLASLRARAQSLCD